MRQAVAKADDQIAKKWIYFHETSAASFIFLHNDRAKAAGIFFIYACFNPFLKDH